MPSFTVDIDIDLNEFNLDELLEEIEDRVERAAGSLSRTNDKNTSDRRMNQLIEVRDAAVEWMEIISRKYKITLPPLDASGDNAAGPRDNGSLYDRLKMEHLLAVIDHYTLDELEQKLPKR